MDVGVTGISPEVVAELRVMRHTVKLTTGIERSIFGTLELSRVT